ncbi:hypothetical protein SKAU_G00366510 [Synaphobranchus kaupii]|uniref:Uncharacterized protein n=1 Tax=Synaphobranchus kaupii TaxID=118154 RepID=A0A9Q1EF86_SYNKA|nr:hypothetical protein SKAU_G00366510 [Synaphobranchus kaupii]
MCRSRYATLSCGALQPNAALSPHRSASAALQECWDIKTSETAAKQRRPSEEVYRKVKGLGSPISSLYGPIKDAITEINIFSGR